MNLLASFLLQCFLLAGLVDMSSDKILLTHIVLCHEPAQNHANPAKCKADQEDSAIGGSGPR